MAACSAKFQDDLIKIRQEQRDLQDRLEAAKNAASGADKALNSILATQKEYIVSLKRLSPRFDVVLVSRFANPLPPLQGQQSR